jgi:hypothetical protein
LTLNTDGRHQAAKSPQVLDLFGNIRATRCHRCGREAAPEAFLADDLPRCPQAGCSGGCTPTRRSRLAFAAASVGRSGTHHSRGPSLYRAGLVAPRDARRQVSLPGPLEWRVTRHCRPGQGNRTGPDRPCAPDGRPR